MNAYSLNQILKETPIAALQYFDATGSTNDIAMDWIEKGAADFSLVVADQQTAGRGRLQRKWITKPGAALAFSVIMHLNQDEIPHASLVPILAAAAVSSALEQLFTIQPEIKWPNDILINRKKAAGILVESSWKDESHASVVIGIGINITIDAPPPPAELKLPAICVEEVVGKSVDRWQTLAVILSNLERWREQISCECLINYVNQRLAYRGENISIVNSFGQDQHGVVQGVDVDGSLLLETGDGVRTILTGDGVI